MWQYALGLDLFPQSVADREIAWYKSHARPYGVPLDSRSDMVKCDWLSWAAAFASSQSDAEELLHYVYLFADQTPSRSPFSDWYNSTTNRMIGFTARPVMGGLYARTLIQAMQGDRDKQQIRIQPQHQPMYKIQITQFEDSVVDITDNQYNPTRIDQEERRALKQAAANKRKQQGRKRSTP